MGISGRIFRTLFALAFFGCLALVLAIPAMRSGDSEPSTPSTPSDPRYVIASGLFSSPHWSEYAGKEWRLVAWGDESTSCFRLEIGQPQGNFEGTLCTSASGSSQQIIEHLGPRAYYPSDSGLSAIAFGQVSKRTAIVEFRLSNGEQLSLPPITPPPELDLPALYYLVFLPVTENGTIELQDDSGEVLHSAKLCHGSCF